ncbi:MAG: heavy-metal-associated domain-containing protein [Firmicutes bacterium]|nr:heavy-metal-associated domain-containing protein [Bacillota bacterium]
MANKTYQLETVTCPSCVAKIEGMLKKTAGISEAEVMFNTSRVKVNFDENVISAEEIRNKIEGLGFKVLGEK